MKCHLEWWSLTRPPAQQAVLPPPSTLSLLNSYTANMNMFDTYCQDVDMSCLTCKHCNVSVACRIVTCHHFILVTGPDHYCTSPHSVLVPLPHSKKRSLSVVNLHVLSVCICVVYSGPLLHQKYAFIV